MQPQSVQEGRETGIMGFLGRWCSTRRERNQQQQLHLPEPPVLELQAEPAAPEVVCNEQAEVPTQPRRADNTNLRAPILSRAPPVLDDLPPSMHVTRFVKWFSESLFDIDQAAALGASFKSDSDMGVHRFWQDPKTGIVYAEILACVVQESYSEFCADQLLIEKAWQHFAKHLNIALQVDGGPLKPYTQAPCEVSGKTHRLRCYRFPVPNMAICPASQPYAEAA